KGLNATIDETSRGSGSLAVVFDSYEFLVPTETDQRATEIYERVAKLRSANILIDRILEKPIAKPRFFSFPSPTAVKNACADGTVATSKYYYEQMADADNDAQSLMEANLPSNPQSVTVHVVDTKLYRSPALGTQGSASTSGAGSAWQCRWEDNFI